MQKGCPHNAFGPCKEEECMFFLSPGHTRTLMTDYTGIQQTTEPQIGRHRCALWHIFVAAQQTLGAQRAASDFAAHRPELIEHADHPQQLELEMLARIESRLEALEWGRKTGRKRS
jgi:hypothetical protein